LSGRSRLRQNGAAGIDGGAGARHDRRRVRQLPFLPASMDTPMLVRAFRLLALAFAVIAGLAAGSRAEPLSAEQKQAVEQLIHDYLLNNPDVLIEALRNAQRANEAKSQELVRKTLVEKRSLLVGDPDTPAGGNAEGDVTIVEFFDYRCPYCKEVEPALERLLKEDKKLRIVYKEFPILGQASVYAARAALAARNQGKYDVLHRGLMAAKGQLDEATVASVATSVGIDMERLKRDMDTPEIDKLLKRNYDLAEALDIQGTPAFVVGDRLAAGVADVDALKKLVAAARKKG
jgi:protein-disulfide isomerase